MSASAGHVPQSQHNMMYSVLLALVIKHANAKERRGAFTNI